MVLQWCTFTLPAIDLQSTEHLLRCYHAAHCFWSCLVRSPPQDCNQKFSSESICFQPFRPFPPFPFPFLSPLRSGPSNLAKGDGGALVSPASEGEKHLQPPVSSAAINAFGDCKYRLITVVTKSKKWSKCGYF